MESHSNPISCHLITWDEDLQTAVREASEIGYRACETFTHMALAYEERIGEFQELLGSHGLRLSALYGGGRFSDVARAAEMIAYNVRVARLLAALGVDRIVFGPAGPRDSVPSLDDLKQMARTIDEAALQTADLGVMACLHPHLGTEIQDRGELDALMELTDERYVGLCPDTAHLSAAGMDPAGVVRTYGSRIRYMHLKDLAPGGTAIEDFRELGSGSVDFDAVMHAVRGAGYTGWLTVEIDRPASTPYESLVQCREFVQVRLGLKLS